MSFSLRIVTGDGRANPYIYLNDNPEKLTSKEVVSKLSECGDLSELKVVLDHRSLLDSMGFGLFSAFYELRDIINDLDEKRVAQIRSLNIGPKTHVYQTKSAIMIEIAKKILPKFSNLEELSVTTGSRGAIAVAITAANKLPSLRNLNIIPSYSNPNMSIWELGGPRPDFNRPNANRIVAEAKKALKANCGGFLSLQWQSAKAVVEKLQAGEPSPDSIPEHLRGIVKAAGWDRPFPPTQAEIEAVEQPASLGSCHIM